MILGNGQIGKTQMRRQLCREKYDDSIPSTHGIQVKQAELAKLPNALAPSTVPADLQLGRFSAMEAAGTAERKNLIPSENMGFWGTGYLSGHACVVHAIARHIPPALDAGV